MGKLMEENPGIKKKIYWRLKKIDNKFLRYMQWFL